MNCYFREIGAVNLAVHIRVFDVLILDRGIETRHVADDRYVTKAMMVMVTLYFHHGLILLPDD